MSFNIDFVCVCVCLCMLFLSCIVLSLFAFLISLSFEGWIGFRINLHGLVWGHVLALLAFIRIQTWKRVVTMLYILVSFCPYSFRIPSVSINKMQSINLHRK